MTPVALMTGMRDGSSRAASSVAARPSMTAAACSRSPMGVAFAAVSACRTRSAADRSAARAASLPYSVSRARTTGRRRRLSMDGRTRGVVMAPARRGGPAPCRSAGIRIPSASRAREGRDLRPVYHRPVAGRALDAVWPPRWNCAPCTKRGERASLLESGGDFRHGLPGSWGNAGAGSGWPGRGAPGLERGSYSLRVTLPAWGPLGPSTISNSTA